MDNATVIKVGKLEGERRHYTIGDRLRPNSYFALKQTLMDALTEVGVMGDIELVAYDGLDNTSLKRLINDSLDVLDEKKYNIRIINKL